MTDFPQESGHVPVLLAESVSALQIRADGVYVDGTFGRGGHSAAILSQLGPGGRLIAIDRDPQAIAEGLRWRAALGDDRVAIVHARFSSLDQVLDQHGIGLVDGLLLDLGVSSPQLDDPARGFSFRSDGPLDMRMDPTQGVSASDWLAEADETEIAAVVGEFGEERFATAIARAIVARRAQDADALRTTGALSRLVASVVRRRQRRPEPGKDPATRTFQALRIFVNQELDELVDALARATARLAPAGRLAVISFHSLEDRIVKRFIARESGRDAPRDPVRGTPMPETPARLAAIARVLPGDAETRANPRARSAVLRVAGRLPLHADRPAALERS